MRSVTNPADMRTYREVVDGQQRLRTIWDFVENRIQLGSNANTFDGMKYEDLNDCDQSAYSPIKSASYSYSKPRMTRCWTSSTG